MKKIYGILMVIFAVFNIGFAQQNQVNTFRINLSPEKLLLHEDGIFLKIGSFGNISLSNLQFDERGYYTTCCLVSACKYYHKQFESCPNTCDECGSKELNVLESEKNNYPTIPAILHAALKSASLNEEIIPCGGKYGVTARVEEDGSGSITAYVEGTDEDENLKLKFDATVRRDSNGKLHGEATLEYGQKF